MSSRHYKSSSAASTNNEAATEVWLDKQDILTRMHISARTLQQWRKENILPFSRIRGKIWYRESDLLELLRRNIVMRKQEEK